MKKVVLALLFILLPSQLGYHFWPDWSLINGIRVDYLSPTIYLTDLIIIVLWIISKFHTTPYPPPKLGGGGHRARVVLIAFIVLNILFSYSPLVSLYKWLKVYEYYWLYKYLVNTQYSIFNIQLGLKIALVWTAALAWVQFLLQRSVGGWLYWLGERTFNITTPGIAKVFLGFGHWDLGFVLRPYATMPHPNALAGWLLVAGLMVDKWPRVIGLLTIPFTFSRSAILLLPLWLWRKSKTLMVLLFAICYLLFANLGNPNSFSERQILTYQSIQIIKQHFWLGTGLGNFVYWVPTIRQPVHNIYLLFISELGLPAFLILSYMVIKSLSHSLGIINWSLKIAALSILLTGLVDHYWLTLPQNILLLVVVIATVKIMSNEASHPL